MDGCSYYLTPTETHEKITRVQGNQAGILSPFFHYILTSLLFYCVFHIKLVCFLPSAKWDLHNGLPVN